MLAHEFAHIRRRDALTSLLASVVRSLFWFHPLAWWLSRKVAGLAEMACDAAVIESQGKPAEYSRVLLSFAADVTRTGGRASLPGLAIAGERDLSRRLDRIFDVASGSLRTLARPAAVVAFSLIPAMCVAAALDFSRTPSRSWRSAPLRLAMYFQGERIGKLDPLLIPGESGQIEPMKPATAEQRAAVPVSGAEDRVFIGKTFLVKGRSLNLALVEPAHGAPYLFADVDLSGAFDRREALRIRPPARARADRRTASDA